MFQRFIRLLRYIRELGNLPGYFTQLHARMDELQILVAESVLSRVHAPSTLSDHEFKVFSQFGDDGIIQYLIRGIEIPPHARTFIEFGVENYTESNTRFLLVHDNWKGLVIDSSQCNVDYIRRDPIYWKHELSAVCAFIDRDNINSLFRQNGFHGEIGILSIDIDGNDYWVWEAINEVDPIIVIVEYNSVFGIHRPITIPYAQDFQRTLAHHSNLYWGASLSALYRLAKNKGYSFVGCNSTGNNSYFVRTDKMGNLREVSLEQGYILSRFRESRDETGLLNHINGVERLATIAEMRVVDVDTNQLIKLGQLQNTITAFAA
jgi:hypothetical protein